MAERHFFIKKDTSMENPSSIEEVMESLKELNYRVEQDGKDCIKVTGADINNLRAQVRAYFWKVLLW